MHAMILRDRDTPLEWVELPDRVPGPDQVRVIVDACGVCRTDLHVIDGELPHPQYPIIPGHEIVGRIDAIGAQVSDLAVGQRVGVPWLGQIGWRSLGIAGDAPKLGLYGFGAAAHILAQVAISQGRSVFAFTRPGNVESQAFARGLGVCWAGSSDELPPEPLDAAILFATVGDLVPLALEAVRKGGRAVCAGIHMSDIPALPYAWLWEERQLVSVANLTRQDGIDFLRLAARTPIHVRTTTYPLKNANEALADLRAGRFDGAAVPVP